VRHCLAPEDVAVGGFDDLFPHGVAGVGIGTEGRKDPDLYTTLKAE
jgi:hypothetical protein